MISRGVRGEGGEEVAGNLCDQQESTEWARGPLQTTPKSLPLTPKGIPFGNLKRHPHVQHNRRCPAIPSGVAAWPIRSGFHGGAACGLVHCRSPDCQASVSMHLKLPPSARYADAELQRNENGVWYTTLTINRQGIISGSVTAHQGPLVEGRVERVPGLTHPLGQQCPPAPPTAGPTCHRPAFPPACRRGQPPTAGHTPGPCNGGPGQRWEGVAPAGCGRPRPSIA